MAPRPRVADRRSVAARPRPRVGSSERRGAAAAESRIVRDRAEAPGVAGEVHKVRAVRPFAVLDKPLLTAAGRWNPSRLRPDAIGDVLAYEAHNLLARVPSETYSGIASTPRLRRG